LDITVAILQLYSFDAYGNAIGFNSAEALTEFLYSGEQFDSKIGQQYLRARYYDSVTGRFNRLDPFFGNQLEPQSFHKYLYAHGDPINNTDPSGEFIPILLLVAGLGLIGTGVGMSTNSAGSFWEGFIPGWGSGRGLGQAINEGDGWGIAVNSIFFALDVFACGGFSLLFGSASKVPKTAKVTLSELENLKKSLIDVAESPLFKKRVLECGFNADNLTGLITRINEYHSKGMIKIAEGTVTWTDELQLMIGKNNINNLKHLSHELTHLLDDVATGLFKKSKGLGWYKTFRAEGKAWYLQTIYGRTGAITGASTFWGFTGGLVTPIANLLGNEGILLPIRELGYWRAGELELLSTNQNQNFD
jgi:RHS repeat-associated protein